MFKVVGRGIFNKQELLHKLTQWGIIDAQEAIKKAERERRVECGDIRILLVM